MLKSFSKIAPRPLGYWGLGYGRTSDFKFGTMIGITVGDVKHTKANQRPDTHSLNYTP
jgi:hypothetical protein